ncbi:MAG: tetratricopeptide repeat protein [Bacteroidales bacterium]|nr:tetratricopeptide repeat protein [Bacteroidales bacterium]
MKLKLSLLAVAAILFDGAVHAQKGVDNGTQFGSGEDSIRCIQNISLFVPYAKSGNYQDAYEFWKIAYDECPAATKDLYLYGVRIMGWKIGQEKDPAKKSALIDDLMAVYDKRIKYFGNDPKYPTSWILPRKAQDYFQYKGADADPSVPYGWLKPIIEAEKESADLLALSMYMFASHNMAVSNDQYKDQYIQDYLKVNDYLDKMIQAAAGDEKQVNLLSEVKESIETGFAQSGVADCATLQNIYGPKVEAQKTDLEFLNKTLTLLRNMRCQESEVYFLASEYAYKIKPTAESAVGLAKQSVKKKDYDQALTYFQDAANLETDAKNKADIYYSMGIISYDQKNYAKARQYCLKAVEENPKFGDPYILIAQMYAATARSIYPDDAIMAKAVYYAAVDKLEKAKSVDPSCAEQANTLIASYRAHFPTTEEAFMHPDLEKGKAITIGGWIGERTICR